mmetsp:Transcript_67870/g.147806  ORF Transcript_67870/g.147806 Transcript_67870/m.147806 type:complete len:87 (-) Transcript_67870:206-466(-)
MCKSRPFGGVLRLRWAEALVAIQHQVPGCLFIINPCMPEPFDAWHEEGSWLLPSATANVLCACALLAAWGARPPGKSLPDAYQGLL